MKARFEAHWTTDGVLKPVGEEVQRNFFAHLQPGDRVIVTYEDWEAGRSLPSSRLAHGLLQRIAKHELEPLLKVKNDMKFLAGFYLPIETAFKHPPEWRGYPWRVYPDSPWQQDVFVKSEADFSQTEETYFIQFLHRVCMQKGVDLSDMAELFNPPEEEIF